MAEVAKANNRPYCKVITTTPNNLDSSSGAFCHLLINEACEFTEDMYDWEYDEVSEFITNNSLNDFLYIKFTWQKLGLTQEWYNKMCRSLVNDRLIIKREVDLEWTKATDNSVFSEDQLIAVFNTLQEEPIELMYLSADDKKDKETGKVQEKFILKVYKPLKKDKRYFIGVDTSGGTGNDSSAFTVVDPFTLEVCAVFKHNKINVSNYTTLLENLVTEVLPMSILIIERNSMGKAVVDLLVRRCPDKVFFDYRVAEKDKSKINHKTENIIYGINTTTASRSQMVDLLSEIVDSDPHLLSIKELYDEVKNLVYKSNGKVEHEDGCHDDVLFSYLFVRFAMAYSNSLAYFLRGIKSISSNSESLGVITRPNQTPTDINGLNKTIDISEEISLLSIEELVKLVDSGENVAKYAKEKFSHSGVKKRELQVNNQTLSTIICRSNKQTYPQNLFNQKLI